MTITKKELIKILKNLDDDVTIKVSTGYMTETLEQVEYDEEENEIVLS